MTDDPAAKRGLTRHVFALTLTAAIVIAAATLRLASADVGASAADAGLLALTGAVFVGMFVILQRTSFTFAWRGHKHRAVLDEIAVYVGFVMLPAPLVVVLMPVCALIEQGMTRREPIKAAFNLSQGVLGAGVAWGLFAALTRLGAPALIAALPTAVLYPVVCNFLLAGILSRLTRQGTLDVFQERFVLDSLLSGAVGASGGVAIAALWSVHPATLVALAPFVYLTRRYSELTSLADRELTVRKRLAEVGHELVGSADVDRAAERILLTCGDLLPSCGRAELILDTPAGDRHVYQDFDAGPAPHAAPMEETVPGRARNVGTLRVYPRRAVTRFAEVERELVRIIASQAGAALEATRALADVESSRARLETYLESAGDAVLLVDRQGRLQYANPAAFRLFGLNQAIVDLAPAITSMLARVPTSGLLETEAKDVRGARRMIVDVHAAPLPTSEPEGGTLMVVRDVTQRKQLESETAKQREILARQEKLSALGTLVAGVAHEINNPVVYMRGAAELAALDLADIREGAHSPEAVRKMAEHAALTLGKLQQGVDRIDKITHALKAVARQGNGERRPESLNAVVEDVVEVVRVGLPKSVHVDLELAPALPRVTGNASELHQVLLNLVKNASEALAGSGTPGRVRVTTRSDDGDRAVVVDVVDDGPGIPEDVQRRLFEPFFTTKPTGTGLGLSLCRGIVEAHGGTIHVESQPGQGTRFTVRLPAVGK